MRRVSDDNGRLCGRIGSVAVTTRSEEVENKVANKYLTTLTPKNVLSKNSTKLIV